MSDQGVCVGCRFAQWKDDPENERRWGSKYGECQHPTAIVLRKTPACVRLDIPLHYEVNVDSIASNGIGALLHCEAREKAR